MLHLVNNHFMFIITLLSHQPIKGLLIWCQICSHSGHLKEISEWFKKNKECPSGCGHKCFQYYKKINLF